MKKIIRLSEEDLSRFIKKIVLEYESEQNDQTFYNDLTFENPKKNKYCKLKVGKMRHFSEENPFIYSPILICNNDRLGEDVIQFEFGELRSRTPKIVSEKVCKYLPKLSSMIERIISKDEESFDLSENTIMNRWEILDEPINCDSDLF